MTHPSINSPTDPLLGGLRDQGNTKGSLSEVSKRSGDFAHGAGCLSGSTAPRQQLRVLDLFSGIGGFSLGLEQTGGFKTVAFCEIEEFPRRVLRKHWPEVAIYEDVRTLTAHVLERDGIAVDVITGGFPCQDVSVAGRGAGVGGEQSGLWVEVIRLVRELGPKYVILENSPSLCVRGGDYIVGAFADEFYDVEGHPVPAVAIGAKHIRARQYLVAYPSRKRNGLPAHQIRPRWNSAFNGGWWANEPGVARMAHGVPDGVDRRRALGNAVVPQIPELIGRAILDVEYQREAAE